MNAEAKHNVTSHDLLNLLARHNTRLKRAIVDEPLSDEGCCLVLMQTLGPVVQIYFNDNPRASSEEFATFFYALAHKAGTLFLEGKVRKTDGG